MVMMEEWFTSITSKILKLSFADSCHHALHCKETWPLRKGKLLETHIWYIWIIRAQGSDWFFYNYTDGRRTRTSRYAGRAEYGLSVRLLFSSYDFKGLTENPSIQCWSEIGISGTDGFDFATPLLQAPTMSLQRKPTWKSNWNQDKHITLESLGHGKLNHYLTLLC